MAGFRLLNCVNAQGPDGIDADFVDRAAGRYHFRPFALQSDDGGRAVEKRTPIIRSTIS
jgi:hypothetical protein